MQFSKDFAYSVKSNRLKIFQIPKIRWKNYFTDSTLYKLNVFEKKETLFEKRKKKRSFIICIRSRSRFLRFPRVDRGDRGKVALLLCSIVESSLYFFSPSCPTRITQLFHHWISNYFGFALFGWTPTLSTIVLDRFLR